jgi:cellulose synthase/poly-beta-1,6-N-acetylglucosamine synthase-like glycosyltransferase
MKCPKCGLLNPDIARRCDCGYDFVSGEIRQLYLSSKEKKHQIESKGEGFFSFRTMISTTLIRIIYVLGMIGLTIIGIVIIVRATSLGILLGIAVIIFGNLLWRIVCEELILLFSIHNILSSIERKLK